ncbi:16S rRNA processing protein RimM [[Clostridium] cellulosi]|jgi:16S rRNA processing protein RimM|uniref:Ribosome maturation factor RimM n=1 Tax=[Clostridium] cellulosi TaxID=29343 RepID=A0A078KTM2_9FIRM|nr:MAG: 16S rRNA processing protein RimM [[Clostridium] cellulosi]CDZ24444.1 16S rRNA processing protein RimM [[Clostridium] cellulosi]
MLKRFLETGQIVGTHGLKGEVRVNPWCDSPDFLKGFTGFYLDNGKTFIKANSIRIHRSIALIKFEGIDDIDEAAKLIKKVIYIDREWVKLPEGSYFEQDLLGLKVVDAETQKVYGTLGEVSKTGANDIYRIDSDGRKTWIPAIKDVVKSVDIENGIMFITPLKGLFDDEN